MWRILGKNYDTRYSRVVSHRSTNLAIACLTSGIGRDRVLSYMYGRSWSVNDSVIYVNFLCKTLSSGSGKEIVYHQMAPECSICLAELTSPLKALQCTSRSFLNMFKVLGGHVYHDICVDRLQRQAGGVKSKCPLCRVHISNVVSLFLDFGLPRSTQSALMPKPIVHESDSSIERVPGQMCESVELLQLVFN